MFYKNNVSIHAKLPQQLSQSGTFFALVFVWNNSLQPHIFTFILQT